MGQAVSGAMDAAKDAADNKKKETMDKLTGLMKVMEGQLKLMENEILAARGDAEALKTTEVAGGRTIMRISQIRVATTDKIADQLEHAIKDFFAAAQSSIDEDDDGAKDLAVKGAANLVKSGIDGLMGVSNGQSMKKKSSVILYLNNAFVRVDYLAYSYAAYGAAWGAESSSSGVCYIADLAVLDYSKLNIDEIKFLISEALGVQPGDFTRLNEIQLHLVQVSTLSKLLQDEKLTFKDMVGIAEALKDGQKAMHDAFKGLKNIPVTA